MTPFEKQILGLLILKYQADHNLQQSHYERTKMLEIAYKLLEPMLHERMSQVAKKNDEQLPF